MPEGILVAIFLWYITFPLRSFRKNDQTVIARVILLVREQYIDELLKIRDVLWNAAANRRNIRGIECRVAGIAAEHAKDSDALVRAHGRALAVNGIRGPRDGG